MITRKIAAALARMHGHRQALGGDSPVGPGADGAGRRSGHASRVLNVLATTKAAAVGGRLMASSAVRKVSFAGSTAWASS